MESTQQAPARRANLPLILIAALSQGAALYALYRAVDAHHWPATNLAWLIAFYAVAFLVPPTVQLTVEYAQRRSLWILTALLAVAVFYFGWHYGAAVAHVETEDFGQSGGFFSLAFVLLVWWLLTLPFLQSRVATGFWKVDYARLFTFAWRNKIMLAEAALFTGLFWLILFLWQALFHMLGIDFFRTLFAKAEFGYPVTAFVFGCALHLIGSIEALVSAVLEQLLNVLKWLATVAGAMLVLFTFALLASLHGLVFSGRRTIDAEWLLWLVAVIVLLLNAAYRDGAVEHPYPRWIAQALRFAVPLTVIIAATAVYALSVRSHQHGLTVQRVWGFIVAGGALLYSVGYSIAAFRPGAWLAMVSRVNVMVAWAFIVVIGAALTPLLSPYHPAAISQYRLILDGRYTGPTQGQRGESPFSYLAFDSGNYGRQELGRLAALQGNPNADQIRDLAAKALKQSNRWESVAPAAAPASSADVAKLPLYPAGRTLDPELSQLLAADWNRYYRFGTGANIAQVAVGIFVDLDEDGTDEFVLLEGGTGRVYQSRSGHWEFIGQLYSDGMRPLWAVTMKSLADGKFAAVAHPWKDLLVGDHRYRMVPEHY